MGFSQRFQAFFSFRERKEEEKHTVKLEKKINNFASIVSCEEEEQEEERRKRKRKEKKRKKKDPERKILAEKVGLEKGKEKK